MVNGFLEAITAALAGGEKVILKDFVTFDPAEMADKPGAPSRPVQKTTDREGLRAGTAASSRHAKGKAAGKEKEQKVPKAAKIDKAKASKQEKVKALGPGKAPEAPRVVKTKTVDRKTAAGASKAPAPAKALQAARAEKVEAVKGEEGDRPSRVVNLKAVARERTEKPSMTPEIEAVPGVKDDRVPRAEVKIQPVKMQHAVFTLGTRYKCYKCGTKFYDLGKPQPICPSCEANQHSEEAKESSKRKRRRRPHLMTKAEPTITAPEEEQDLIEVVDEVDAEYVLDVDDIVLEEGPDET